MLFMMSSLVFCPVSPWPLVQVGKVCLMQADTDGGAKVVLFIATSTGVLSAAAQAHASVWTTGLLQSQPN